MKERIQDSFRQWYLDYKRETGIFPEFPSDEDFAKPDFMFGMDKKEVSIEGSLNRSSVLIARSHQSG